jgi:hypothetical protein
MKSVNDQFAEMQKKTLENLEPIQNLNAVAAEAFERIARKNYDLMGDLMEYAVAQVKAPATTTNLQDVYEQRVAETKAFAEKVNARAAEYVTLASELGELAKSKGVTAPKANAAPAKSTPAKAAPAKAKPAKSEPVAESVKPVAAKTASAAPATAPENKPVSAAAKKKAPAKKTAAKAK